MSRSIAAAMVLAAVALPSLPTPAAAHTVGLSFGELMLKGDDLEADLVFARKELLDTLPALDADKDGALTDAELEAGRADLLRVFVSSISVTIGGARAVRCPGRIEKLGTVEGDGASMLARFVCPERPDVFAVELGFLETVAAGHRHIVKARTGGSAIDVVAYRRNAKFELPIPGRRRPAGAPAGATAAPASGGGGFAGLFVMGIEHIVTGWDHLLFLFGLILVGGRLRSLIGVVTAFTLAHSITLGAAALGVWSPSPRFIEPMIALSVAYVGIENWFVDDAAKRWRLTFPFGLIHGFGFAGALRELAIPRSDVPAALLAFNLGVEAGQLAVLAIVLPALILARKRAVFATWGVRGLSTAIACAGMFWFVTRLIE